MVVKSCFIPFDIQGGGALVLFRAKKFFRTISEQDFFFSPDDIFQYCELKCKAFASNS